LTWQSRFSLCQLLTNSIFYFHNNKISCIAYILVLAIIRNNKITIPELHGKTDIANIYTHIKDNMPSCSSFITNNNKELKSPYISQGKRYSKCSCHHFQLLKLLGLFYFYFILFVFAFIETIPLWSVRNSTDCPKERWSSPPQQH